MKQEKLIIYQVLTRTFGNKNQTRKKNGSLHDNGVGKMNDFSYKVLRQIANLGANSIWFTGILRHATTTNYASYGIPLQTPIIVKGKAGSPYAITDYYDIDPDISVNVPRRMQEFEALIHRCHHIGLKIIIDFVPNHVAREYKSIAKPDEVKDLGESDDKSKHFDAQNNFYYCPNEHLDLSAVTNDCDFLCTPYEEYPAKCTGNDKFDAYPQRNDWYETVKLNYGVDYCDLGGRSSHFSPIPSTWLKMTDVLLFWAGKGINGFRCDMAEMVPKEFWSYTIKRVKERYPDILFIGEVYNPSLYRSYLHTGFDFLYDKVGMYDCLREVICNRLPASSITQVWQNTDDIRDHMLYFLENHDEQRVASNFFSGNALKGIPGMIVSALLRTNPFMIYAGQEFGERGMDEEGFSGLDGRSTIFDYWCVDGVYNGYFSRKNLTPRQLYLETMYKKILNICNVEKAVREGKTFDLMYANLDNHNFNDKKLFAFLRKSVDETLFVLANFDNEAHQSDIIIPTHAFDYLELKEGNVNMTDLLSGEKLKVRLSKDGFCKIQVDALSGRIYKF